VRRARRHHQRVVIFRTGQLGDTVCAIPAFRLLRHHFPNAELVLLCDQSLNGAVAASDVVGPLGIFDRTETYLARHGWRTTVELVARVVGLHPQVVVILPQDSEPPASITRKVFFFRLFSRADVRSAWVQVDSSEERPNEADRLIKLLNSIGISGQKPGYDLPYDVEAVNSSEDLLRGSGVDIHRPFIVFCGGGKSRIQHWPLDRYMTVFLKLRSELNLQVVAIGSARDVERYDAAGFRTKANVALLRPLDSVRTLFALCARGVAYFGNDTGPAHVCAAAGRPAAVVMSGRAPRGSWDPDVQPRLVIRSDRSCQGCTMGVTEPSLHQCMTDISSEKVLEAVLPFFQKVVEMQQAAKPSSSDVP
jgi:heptosyltransferase II